ncbi:MAG: T9SS type A sorting domain-containing protein [Flavobacteriales bacterium]
MKNRILVFIMLFSLTATAQFGTLDGDFDADGIKEIVLADWSRAYDVAVQPDGKIVVCGTTSTGSDLAFYLSRLQPDGSFDLGFGQSGTYVVDLTQSLDYLYAVEILADGKILAAGTSGNQVAVVKSLADGSYDATFGSNGNAILFPGHSPAEMRDLKVLPDGKILVSGLVWEGSDYNFALMRLNADGSADVSFSFDGVVTTNISDSDAAFAMQVHDNGKITLAGNDGDSRAVLVQYNADGTLNNAFGTGGKVTLYPGGNLASFEGLAIDSNGKLVAVGYATDGVNPDDLLVARINEDGSLDNTFSTDGYAITNLLGVASDELVDVVIQEDGKILACGNSYNFQQEIALARYNPDGTLDNSFGTGGAVTTSLSNWAEAYSIALQADGKAVVCGTKGDPPNSIVARYITGTNIGIGEVDAYIGSTLVYPNPISENSVTVEYELKSDETVSIELYDLAGKQITTLQASTKEKVGSYQKTLSLPTLSAGNYLLKLNTAKGAVSVQLTVSE